MLCRALLGYRRQLSGIDQHLVALLKSDSSTCTVLSRQSYTRQPQGETEEKIRGIGGSDFPDTSVQLRVWL